MNATAVKRAPRKITTEAAVLTRAQMLKACKPKVRTLIENAVDQPTKNFLLDMLRVGEAGGYR
jgi:hypothetical protein